MEYVIVSNKNSKVVEKRVVYYLQIGYKLHGELSVVYDSNKQKMIYTQALIKGTLTVKVNNSLPRRDGFTDTEWEELDADNTEIVKTDPSPRRS